MKKKHINKKLFKRIILSLFFINLAITLAFAGYLFYVYDTSYLDIDAVTNNNLGVSIYDGDDNLLPTSATSSKKLIDITTLPKYVLNAFVSVEDKHFYTHNGIEPYRMAKAFFVNMANRDKTQGASTITQQLIKNTILSSEKTYKRKIKEIMLALKLEKQMSKQQILQEYLNTIYFGENCYGIENASEHYFGRSADSLTLSQAATLAGIINAPAIYSPTDAPQKTIQRRDFVLKTMLKNKKITQAEYNDAINADLAVLDNPKSYINSYIRTCILETCKLLGISEKEFIRARYKIYTYLDTDIQNSLEENVASIDDALAQQLVVNNDTFSIIAYSGNGNIPLFNAKRQPASLVKPILIYLPCFEEKILSPATPILDEKINIDGYIPQNYNKQYLGWTNVRTSLQKSLNIPAIKALSYLTIDKCFHYAKQLDIPLTDDDKNYALALGSITDGLPIYTISSGYCMLANDGKYCPISMIRKIENADGEVLYTRNIAPKQIYSQGSCYLITDILSPNINAPTTYPLDKLNMQIASKTGTASVDGKLTDLWNVAYTPDYTITSWIGTTDTTQPLNDKYVSSRQASTFCEKLLASNNKLSTDKQFLKPQDVVSINISDTQYNEKHILMQATNNEQSFSDIFLAGNVPQLQENASPHDINEGVSKKKKWWFI